MLHGYNHFTLFEYLQFRNFCKKILALYVFRGVEKYKQIKT